MQEKCRSHSMRRVPDNEKNAAAPEAVNEAEIDGMSGLNGYQAVRD